MAFQSLLMTQMENWVWNTLETKLDTRYTYHSVDHIRGVVEDVHKIMPYYDLSSEDQSLLKTAALFHDLAFIRTHLKHEQKSAQMAQEELPKYGFNQEQIDKVKSMIMATRIPQQPQNLLDEILCDADLYYLGGPQYFEISNQLKEELIHLGLIKDEKQWLEQQISFLKAHQYHTDYALKILQPGKERVIKQVQEKLTRLS